MKRLICLFAFILSAVTINAQVLPEEIPFDSKFSFVIDSDINLNSKMSRAKSWIAKTFGDYKSVLQFEDPDNHRIIIKGVSKLDTKLNFNTGGRNDISAQYTITFDFKEDKYRIAFDNVKIHEIKTLYKGGMVHETDWSPSFLYDRRETSYYTDKLSHRLDSLNTIEGRPNREMKKIEKEKKQIQKELETELISLKKKKTEADHDGKLYRNTLSSIINGAISAISTTDDF